MINYESLGDRILIKPNNPTVTTATGLAMGETNKIDSSVGEVMQVGTGVPLTNINLNINLEGTTTDLDKMNQILERVERITLLMKHGREIKVKIGDMVNFGKHAGTKITIDKVDYVMIRDADVFGRIPKTEPLRIA